MNSKYIVPAIIGGSILGLFLIGLMTAFTAQNGAMWQVHRRNIICLQN